MGSIISSLKLVGACSVTIVAISALVLGIWRASGFVGYPVGAWLVQRVPGLASESEAHGQHNSRGLGAMLGLFISCGLLQYHVANPVGVPHFSEPGRSEQKWWFLIWLWIFGTVLQSCFEALLVLAILTGVVNVSERGSRQGGRGDAAEEVGHTAFVDVEKESGRTA